MIQTIIAGICEHHVFLLLVCFDCICGDDKLNGSVHSICDSAVVRVLQILRGDSLQAIFYIIQIIKSTANSVGDLLDSFIVVLLCAVLQLLRAVCQLLQATDYLAAAGLQLLRSGRKLLHAGLQLLRTGRKRCESFAEFLCTRIKCGNRA